MVWNPKLIPGRNFVDWDALFWDFSMSKSSPRHGEFLDMLCSIVNTDKIFLYLNYLNIFDSLFTNDDVEEVIKSYLEKYLNMFQDVDV